MFLPLTVSIAIVTNTAAIAISNIRSPSIGYGNVDGERENLRYLRTDRPKHGPVELGNEILGNIRRL